MLILDTSELSELMRERPISEVFRWVDNQLTGALSVVSITEAEIRTGGVGDFEGSGFEVINPLSGE